ncbi:hypothetical protein [Fibrella forsythiae]|uniref:Lipoprotein n=1 Tax=Fibrella forsythiae TaxID=2817061 RepID=A0ABS3JGR9_9BACT|nr:hypothetical protein [Fibrella forsythiae]MBO0949200.1 hypothetical protein [Fibrella forsythiae]
MKRSIWALLIITLLNGCAVLNKTQVDAVNQFALISRNFSAYPSRIIIELDDIRRERGLYNSNSLIDDPTAHIDNLNSLYDFQVSNSTVSEKVDITFRIIDKYAQSLQLLTSDRYTSDVSDQVKSLSIGLDSLSSLYNSKIRNTPPLPTGIGNVVSQLVARGGRQLIRARQAKELKLFVPRADALIDIMCKNLLEFLEQSRIQELLDNEANNLPRDFKLYLISRAQLKSNSSIKDEQAYLNLRSRLDGVKLLKAQSIAAVHSLQEGHHKLVSIVMRKMTLTDNIKEVQIFYEDVKQVRATIQRIDIARTTR